MPKSYLQLKITPPRRGLFIFANLGDFPADWFVRGRIKVISGAGASLIGWIKSDQMHGDDRIITLWEPLRADIQPGDQILMHPGCDKHHTTCQAKFNNIVNFQGFPFIPGEDWLTHFPSQNDENDGGALV